MSNPRAAGGFNIKETLTAVVISFTMAFVFRGFVIEGFLIPTGSMAPTLLGKHMLVRDPDSGYAWTVGPWDYVNGNPNLPYPVQGGTNGPIKLNDPVTGEPIELASERLRAGDRLFVLKYLKGVYDPSRWEVVVFKPPHKEPQNYIKRLIGLPGDQIALVDGDVFYAPKGSHAKGTGAEAWAENVWKIARKPERVQREVWRKVFDSTYTPPAPTRRSGSRASERFRPPWVASGSGWTGLRDSRDYRYEGSSPTVLSWDDERWPIDDYTAYNQLRVGPQPFDRVIRDRTRPIFPVSDVSTHFGIEPESGPVKVTGSLTARGMEFRAVIDDAGAKVELREALTTESTDIAWRTLDSSNRTGLITPGRVTNVEFWHVDQALWLFVDGKLVCGGPEKGAYELTPSGRVFASTGRELIELLRLNPNITNTLADTRIYRKPSLRWRFEGGPFTLHRVGLDRDLYYQCGRMPTLGGHPDHFPTLSDDDFMMCGDNSPSSLDSRFWDAEYPWVTESINHGEPQYGLVPRELLIGRAFVVYLPSPFKRGAIPMFDFTRMRWVW